MNSHLWLIMASVALLGCGQPRTAPPEPAPTNAAEPVASASSDAEIAATLSELTQATRRFAMEQQRVPKSLDEVVAGGYLKSVPPAPAGKVFAINKSLQVYLKGR